MGLNARHYKVHFGPKAIVNLSYPTDAQLTTDTLVIEARKELAKRGVSDRDNGSFSISAYVPARQRWEPFFKKN